MVDLHTPVVRPTNGRKLRFDIGYDGTDFRGWAYQPDQRTVAGVLNQTLSTVLRNPVELAVAGRTDAGVHASGQVAHCTIDPEWLELRGIDGDPARLVRRLARMLPADIVVKNVQWAADEFDARFSAIRRHYEYQLSTQDWGVEPTRARDIAHWLRPVDFSLVQQASDKLLGLHNFAAFCRHKKDATTIRELQGFRWEYEGCNATAYVSADAFCWSMVRSLVGAVMAVGEGRRPLEWIDELLLLEARSSAVPVAPACGLSLVKVDYPSDSELVRRNNTTRDVRTLP